jgi:protein-tyrosine phosphatase
MSAATGRVRRAVLIRSDAPVELGAAGRGTLNDLGVRTAIDLRELAERDNAPADIEGLDIELVIRPLLGEVAEHADLDLKRVYDGLLDRRGEAFVAAITAIADAAPEPTIIFCSAGKDRTGMLSALVLLLLGVGEAEIVADYHRTEANMQGAFRERVMKAALSSGLTEQQIAVGLGAPEELMRHVIGRLRSEGGVEAYLTRHGLRAETIHTLRTALLEP